MVVMVFLDTSKNNALKAEFTPPVQESIISGKFLALWILNLITLGIYSSVDLISKKFERRNLEACQNDLELKASSTVKEWKKLEDSVEKLRRDINLGNSELIDNKLEGVSNKIKKLKEFPRLNPTTLNNIGFVAFDCLRFLGIWFTNVTTLGLYGSWHNFCQKHEVQVLKEKNTFIVDTCHTEKDRNCARISEQVDVLKKLWRLESTLKLIEISPDGIPVLINEAAASEIKNEMAIYKISVDALSQKNQSLQKESEKLKTDYTTVEQARKSLVEKTMIVSAYLTHQIKEASHFSAQNSRIQSEVHSLRTDTTTTQLRAAQQAAETIKTQLNQVQETLNMLKRNKGDISNLVPIPPIYKQRLGVDHTIAGTFQRVNENGDIVNDDTIAYSRKFKDCDTLLSLLKLHLPDTFAYLLNQPFVKINKSDQNLWHPGIYNAVYNLMTFNLLLDAGVTKGTNDGDCHGYSVDLNQHVKIRPSNPIIMRSNKDGEQNDKIVFSNYDEWSVADCGDAIHGIDPVSAMWILSRSDILNYKLRILLLQDLIPEDNAILIATRRFMENKENPEVQLIETAYTLITTMAKVLHYKYGDKLRVSCWDELCNEDIEPAFIKSEIKIIKDNKDKIIPWDTNASIKYFGYERLKVNGAELYSAPTMASYMKTSLEKIKQGLLQAKGSDYPIGGTCPAKLPEDFSLIKNLLSRQYWMTHFVLNDYYSTPRVYHGCLFSSLWTLTCIDSNYVKYGYGNVQFLKNAMANFLGDAENGKLFKEVIAGSHKTYVFAKNENEPMTVEDFCYWLKNGSTDTYTCNRMVDGKTREIKVDMTEDGFAVVLQIYAAMLKVQVNVFTNKCQIKEKNGFIVPANDTYTFGPRTDVQLNIFCNNSKSFYALLPKIKDEKHQKLMDYGKECQTFTNM